MSKYIERLLREDETLIKKVKVHWITLLPHILLIIVVIGIFTIWKPLVDILTTELGFTNKKILGKEGWVNVTEINAPLSKITNVSVYYTFWGKICGYGTIRIDTASGSYTFERMAKITQFKYALMAQIESLEQDHLA